MVAAVEKEDAVMRPPIVCLAAPTLLLLVSSLLAPAGWAQGLTATETERGLVGSGVNPAPGDDSPRANGGLLYLVSLEPGYDTFMVYDPVTSAWTPLNGYETGCQMAVSIAGNLYARRRDPDQIEVYDPNTDSWSYVMESPPGTTGTYCNLEITRNGQFLFTDGATTAVHYTAGGTWHSFDLPFTVNLLGDYDPDTQQYVIGEEYTLYAHMIDLTSWTITDFLLGPASTGEASRFGSLMGGRFYCQANTPIYSYDLADPAEPPQDHGYQQYYPSSAADRAAQVIYVASLDGTQLWRFNPADGTMIPLTPQGTWLAHSSIAFAAPWEKYVFSDGFESGDTSAWSATVP